ncbi:hypothetical protein F2Q70_00003343, partial [Brassica cretica]
MGRNSTSQRSVDVARSLVQGTRKYSENLGRLSESIAVSFLVIYDRGCQIHRPEKRKTTESSTGILNVDSYVVIWPSNFAFHSNLPISETTTGGAERQFHQRDPNSNISKRKDKMLTSFSWVCWFFPTSVMAQQIGSGLHGLGVGAIGLDWSTISSYLGSPLASPWFATANVGVGFVLAIYVVVPICYWLDVFKAKTFPLYSSSLFTSEGSKYNITSIIDSKFHLDLQAYEREGPLYLSTFFAISYGIGFAALSATIVHVALFHGRYNLKHCYIIESIWEQSKQSFKEKKIDIHTRLMRRYKEVPEWWFWCILAMNISVTIFACEYYIDQLQLPWWGVLLACTVAIIFTLPIGILTAITNQ